MTTEKASEALTDLNVALRRYGFGTPAIGVESAEGWHERYFWTDEDQVMAVARLEDLGRRSVPVERTGGCSRLRSAGVHSATCARECAAVTPAHASAIPT
jgi:hypothetical protein